MKVLKTDYDKYGWKTRVYSRNKGKEIVIQRQSNKKPSYNHEVYLEGESLEIVKKIINEKIRN